MVVVEENRSEEQSTVETTMNDIEALVDLKSSISFRIKSSISEFTPNICGSMKLLAARYNDVDNVTRLASAGVRLDSKEFRWPNCGSTMVVEENRLEDLSTVGTTTDDIEALVDAARYNDVDDVVSLASAGVHLDSKDSEGRTALHMAAANGHLSIVEFLISKGVDVNALNAEKNTPLHWACLNGHIEVVKKLILSGANVSLLNSHEKTPMDEALTRGKMDVIDAINTAVAQIELTGISVSSMET
ncbi:Ankyrin repeat domain-containing protein 2A, partial [Cucurbita argyrosperma subsp. sororia]